jgi:hypothetical protein
VSILKEYFSSSLILRTDKLERFSLAQSNILKKDKNLPGTTNIKQGRKGSIGTNALAYFANYKSHEEKSFKTLSTGGRVHFGGGDKVRFASFVICLFAYFSVC